MLQFEPVEERPFRKPNAWDRLNCAILMAFTPEKSKINACRKKHTYGETRSRYGPGDMQLAYVTIQGVRVRIAHSRQEGKPTLLLLNPLPQSIVAYAPIWQHLAQKYDLIAYDLPGFGWSDGDQSFMNFKAQGDFLHAFIEAMELDSVHLVGPDIGMPAILYYVGAHKHRAVSITIGDGPGIDPSQNGSVIDKMVHSKVWQFIFSTVSSGAFVEVGNQVGYVVYNPSSAEVSDYIHSYRGRIKTILKWFKGYPESLAQVNPLLEHIEIPTLIFWGQEDQLLYLHNGKRLVERMPNAQLRVLEEAGHFSYQDQHEDFIHMLDSWIEREHLSVNKNNLTAKKGAV